MYLFDNPSSIINRKNDGLSIDIDLGNKQKQFVFFSIDWQLAYSMFDCYERKVNSKMKIEGRNTKENK